MKNKKYILTSETIEVGDTTLYRIKAIKDFGTIKDGDLGGFVESEDNLSHDGYCWVSGDARVYGDAKVFGIAEVSGDAKAYGNARVSGKDWISGDAKSGGKIFTNCPLKL